MEDIFDYEHLEEAFFKCRKNVSWKPSVKDFTINNSENILKMSKQIHEGTWKNGKPRKILILYPKKREGLSISFRDRVYQRCINDYVLYPEMTKHFIFDNWACQKGKGPDFARRRFESFIRKEFINNGLNSYLLQIDITGYYPNMRHDEVDKNNKRYLDPYIFSRVKDVLDTQYVGDVGYNPGSQMVQIAGISLLNPVDHYIKEELNIKHYGRYMDDMELFLPTYKEALDALHKIEVKLNGLGFQINQKKTKITPLAKPFEFLGFIYKVTNTGKIIKTKKPESVKHERKKITRMATKCAKGELSEEKMDDCINCYLSHLEKGNSKELIRKLNNFSTKEKERMYAYYSKRRDA